VNASVDAGSTDAPLINLWPGHDITLPLKLSPENIIDVEIFANSAGFTELFQSSKQTLVEKPGLLYRSAVAHHFHETKIAFLNRPFWFSRD
jgi:hypothetical protein